MWTWASAGIRRVLRHLPKKRKSWSSATMPARSSRHPRDVRNPEFDPARPQAGTGGGITRGVPGASGAKSAFWSPCKLGGDQRRWSLPHQARPTAGRLPGAHDIKAERIHGTAIIAAHRGPRRLQERDVRVLGPPISRPGDRRRGARPSGDFAAHAARIHSPVGRTERAS